MKFTGERMIPELNKDGEIFLEHMNRYIFACQFAKNRVVLDIACGSGYGSDLLLKAGAKKVYGVDISKEAIDYCKKKYPHKNLDFIVGDVRKIPLKDKSIDLLVSFETIEHINEKDQEIFMNEIERVLKPRGVLIMSTPNITAFRAERENDFHLKELKLKEYLELLQSKFKFNKIYYQDNLESNFILSKNETTNLNYFLKGKVTTSKIESLKTKDAVFFVSVSSSKALPKIKGNVSLLNKNEKHNLVTHIKNLENLERERKRWKDQFLKENYKKIKKLENNILTKNLIIKEKNRVIREYAKIVHDREMQLNAIANSLRWKVPNYFYKLFRNRIIKFRPRHAAEVLKRGSQVLKREGASALAKGMYDYIIFGKGRLKEIDTDRITDYERWINKNEQKAEYKTIQRIKKTLDGPKISIIISVLNPNEIFLRKAILSVIYQSYQNWELCVVDNGSTNRIIRKILEDFQKKDKRIKVLTLVKREAISAGANKAAKMASGDFIGFLGHDDELSSNTLFENVKLLNQNPKLDLIYSDEDKIDENGTRRDPHFKPDWSPELLISYDYIGHFKIIRRKLFISLGGYRPKYDGYQDYDLLLRLAEKTNQVGHITKVIYHQRNYLEPAYNHAAENQKKPENGRLALEDALRRRKIKGQASIPEFAKETNLDIYKIKFNLDNYNEKITIIIPTKDRIDLLKRCIKSIQEKTSYKNFEILVVDNNSKERKTLDYLKNEKINYVSIPTKTFNFARINNLAVRKAKTELILFLNNDTEVISSNWLGEMAGTMSLDDKIAAVGAKLIYADKRVQHAGVIVGLSQSTASHANKFLRYNDPGYQSYNLAMRNYSAVTAACMLTKKSLFQKMGGFDEKNHAVFCNDVDYCLKLISSGYRVVFNPDALLYHYESKSRGLKDNIKEIKHFRKKWNKFIKKDPSYNINLSQENERFELKKNW